MKTTKDIVEIFCGEIDRIAKGEVRKDVITALEKCSNSLVKLARLEMDFAFRNWGEQPPTIPWMASKVQADAQTVVEPPPKPTQELATVEARTSRGQHIEKEIKNAQKELKTATGTMKTILTDKINLLRNKLERAEAQKDSEAEE